MTACEGGTENAEEASRGLLGPLGADVREGKSAPEKRPRNSAPQNKREDAQSELCINSKHQSPKDANHHGKMMRMERAGYGFRAGRDETGPSPWRSGPVLPCWQLQPSLTGTQSGQKIKINKIK